MAQISRIDEWTCKVRNADGIYTKYALYYPGKLLYSSPVHTIHNPPYKINNGLHPSDTTKQTISNKKLWSITQHKKSYYKGRVPEYDDLLLKYDTNDNPVLHPLLNLYQIYIHHPEQSDDEVECTDDQQENYDIYNYFIPTKEHKNNKDIENKLKLAVLHSEPLEDFEKVIGNME